jgi:hypothetical protein
MKKDKAYPGKYMKAGDVGPDMPAVTISSVTHEPMNDGVVKPVAHFSGWPKGVVVNVGNADVLYKLAGSDDDDDWPGLEIELYTEMARMPGREPGPSIRFRAARHPIKKGKASTDQAVGYK